MNLQEAYNLIDEACASLSLNRVSHIRLQEALEVIKKKIEEKEVKSQKNG